MKRILSKKRITTLIIAFSAASIFTVRIAVRAQRVPNDNIDKPNIIFILSDNIQWNDFGFMNHPFIRTPGLDQLAAEGVVFENAFHTTPLCSPSRASILTGTYAHNHGIKNNYIHWTGQKTTFLELLKGAGYDTAFIGKWHMPGKGLPEMPFLDLFVSYTYREGQGSYIDCPLIVNGKETPPGKRYLTEELTDRALAFIEKRISDSGVRRPFCLYLSHRAAHPPFVPPDDIRGLYKKETVELPQGVDSWFSKTNGNVFQGIMMGSYANQYRKYCEVITAMDRQIQRFLSRIDDLGLAPNTIVIFAADNGMMWGEHRCHGIRRPYEESIRIPVVVRCPWLIDDPGGYRSQMVLNLDIAPTILDIAGLPVPEDMDGESMLPYLTNKDKNGRTAWLLEFWKYFPENTPGYVGIRTKTHKYVEYKKTLKPLIFDLGADLREHHNLYGTPAGNQLLPELKRQLKELRKGKKL